MPNENRVPNLETLKAEHPEACFVCGDWTTCAEMPPFHGCTDNPMMAALTAAKLEDEARIAELEGELEREQSALHLKEIYRKGLESDLAASEARERELQGKLDAAEAASEKDERDCLTVIDERDAREEVIGEAYQLVMDEWPEWSSDFGFKDALDAMNERLGADMRERESLKSERDAALAQVGVLRGVIDDFYNYEGGSVDPREDDHLMERAVDALTDTQALANQRVEAIKREAVEKVIKAVCTKGHDFEVFSPEVGTPYFRESSLREGLAAILGEKGQG